MIIYDTDQNDAVNLANVDTVTPGGLNAFVIFFNRTFLHEGTDRSRPIARWDYRTKEDRDKTFDAIIKGFGKRFDDNVSYPT